MQIQIREATPNDVYTIARLHAESWKQAYRGVLTDVYLDERVEADRMQAWQKRFAENNPNQWVILWYENDVPVGFAALFLHEDAAFGHLVDNLHVLPDWQGRGLGRKLMAACAEKGLSVDENQPIHLWVYAENHAARRVYARWQGEESGTIREKAADEEIKTVIRYVWPDPVLLLPRAPHQHQSDG